MGLVNEMSKKLSFYDKFKTLKCLEEHLYHVLVKLKIANDKYIDLAVNPKDFEKASEI